MARFAEDAWERPGGGGGRSRVLAEGGVFEQAGVGFSHVFGPGLPPSATAPAAGSRRTLLRGDRRLARLPSAQPLRPHDAHERALLPRREGRARSGLVVRRRLRPHPLLRVRGGRRPLPPHRPRGLRAVRRRRSIRGTRSGATSTSSSAIANEPRGIGGLFFDDLHEWGFDRSFAFLRSVGDHFLPAYLPILRRRRDTPYGERERDFQLYRRGRYVEFNLVWDRGTLFGLQSGGRTESILMSLPPLVRWRYNWRPEPGTPEARLYEEFLRPREWAEGG